MFKKKILILLSVLILAGCTQTSAPNVSNNTDPSQQSQTDSNGNQDEVDYALDLLNFNFSPNLIEGEPGETVKIKLSSKNGDHDFIIDELGVRSRTLASGESQVLEVTIPDDAVSGSTYEFYCSISNHRAMGMVGTL